MGHVPLMSLTNAPPWAVHSLKQSWKWNKGLWKTIFLYKWGLLSFHDCLRRGTNLYSFFLSSLYAHLNFQVLRCCSLTRTGTLSHTRNGIFLQRIAPTGAIPRPVRRGAPSVPVTRGYEVLAKDEGTCDLWWHPPQEGDRGYSRRL